ncbi:MAG: PA14 domain-containing protein, partial [Planctomycetota bacterium]|nr:PA14 domain-containing protein [Planctomycetota bacterium]
MRTITSRPWGSSRSTIDSTKRRRGNVLAAAVASARPVFEALESRQLLSQTILYHFEDADVSSLADSSGNSNTGSGQSGAVFDTGKVGQGVTLDGAAAYISAPVDLQPWLGDTGSLATWIKTTQVGSNTTYEAPGLAGGDQNGAASDVFWGILNASGQIGITVGNNAAVNSPAPVNDGLWHHVAFTRNGTTGALQVYVDGFMRNSATQTAGSLGHPFAQIGGMVDDTGLAYGYFNGTLDDVAVYDSVATAAQIAQLYNPGGALPAAPTDLAVLQTGSAAVLMSWTDNASNASGFKVERATNIAGPFTEIADVTGTTYKATGLAPNTPYYFRVRAYNPSTSGTIQYSAYTNVPTTTTGPAAVVGTGTGLMGIYFDDGGYPSAADPNTPDLNAAWTGKLRTRTDATVNFNWGAGAPMQGMGADTFGVRWIGQIEAQYTENYAFFTQTDDGARLYIDGNLVIDDLTYHGIGAERTSETLVPGGIALNAGQKYTVMLEMFENAGDAGARLLWSSFSTEKAIIPQTQVYAANQPTKPSAASSVQPVAGWDNGGIAEATSNVVTLTWQNSNDVSNLIGYKILRSNTSGGTYTEIARVGGQQFVDGSVYPGKAYYYKVVAYNLAGDATASAASPVVNTTALPVQPGLLGSYYDNITLQGLSRHIRADGDIAWNVESTVFARQFGVVNWPDIAPSDPAAAPIIDSPLNTGVTTIDDGENLSIRWEGLFTAATNDTYTFYTRTDDAVRLYVNGQRLIAAPDANNFTVGQGDPGIPGNTGSITLNAGTYPILMEYNQGTGGGRAELRWKGPGMATYAMLTTMGVEDGASQVLSSKVNTPAAPTGFTAAVGAVTVGLSWTDNATNEFLQRVEMSTDAGATWSTLTEMPGISNVGGAAAAVSYFVSGLASNTAYRFRLTVINSAGEQVSTVNVTTKVPPPMNATSVSVSGDTNLTTEGKLSWSHWGFGHNTQVWNSGPAGTSLIMNVVETGGVNEPTDTITAKWTGQTWLTTQANEPLLNTPVGTPFTLGTIQHLAPAFVDRNHAYSNLLDPPTPMPFYLVGCDYIMTGNDNRDRANYRLDVTIGKPARVYMLIDNRLSDGDNTTPPTFGPANMQWILDQQWTPTNAGLNRSQNTAFPDEMGFDEGANGDIQQYFSIYYKDFSAGTFTLRQPDNAGRNMYGVVIKESVGTNIVPVGSGTIVFGDTPGKTFSWTNGAPTIASPFPIDDTLAMAGAGNGFSFNVSAQNYSKRLNVYLAADVGTTGLFSASVSDGSIAPFSQTVTGAGDPSKPANYMFSIDFQAENPQQTLFVSWVNQSATGKIYLSADTIVEAPPFAPSLADATAVAGGGIRVSWQDNSINETQFKIERKGPGQADFVQIATVGPNTTAWTDADLTRTPNGEYFYRVRGSNTAGDSDYTNIDSVIEQLPAAPIFGVGPDDSKVTIAWQLRPGVTSYNIKRATSAAGPFTNIAPNVTGSLFVDTTVTNRTTYYYVMSSVKQGFEGPDSAVQSAMPSPKQEWIKVNFTVSGGEDVAGYVRDDGYQFGGGSYDVAGNTYYFGWELFSDTDGDGVPDTFVPTDNTVNSRNRNSANSGGDERLDSLSHLQKNLANNQTFNADMWEIDVPNGDYRILIASGDPDNVDAYFAIDAENVLAVRGQPNTGNRFISGVDDLGLFVDVTVTDGKLTITNDLAEQAKFAAATGATGTNAANNKIDYIEIYRLVETATRPAAPTDLTAESTTNVVKLTWVDASNNEDGFKIERRLGTGAWTEIADRTYAQTSYPGSPTFTDYPPAAGTYSYRVYSYNNAGKSTAASNIATAVVTVAPPLHFDNFDTFDTALWQLNDPALTPPTVIPGDDSHNLIRLTESLNDQTASAFTTYGYDIRAFDAKFKLRFSGGSGTPADGIVFALQSQAPTALGGGGGSLGFNGIRPAVGVKFDIYAGQLGQTGLYVNSDVNADGPQTGLAFLSGNVYEVTLDYNGTTLKQTIVDTVTSQQFTTTYTLDLVKALGGTWAYIGWTGATGGENATQDILSLTFDSKEPTPPLADWIIDGTDSADTVSLKLDGANVKLLKADGSTLDQRAISAITGIVLNAKLGDDVI